VSLGNLQKISKALGITLSELFKTVEKRAEAAGRDTARRIQRRHSIRFGVGFKSPCAISGKLLVLLRPSHKTGSEHFIFE